MSGRLIVFSNCTEGSDDEFNRWYDDVHLREVLSLGPIVACQRFRVSDEQAMEQTHRYLAIYEFEGSAADARSALLEGASRFNMSDTLDTPFMSITEELGPRVSAP